MFILESSIAQWKEMLSSLDSVRAEDVLELESHLRDLVTRLGKQDLSEQEAFLVATHRLGHPTELNKEFSKVHGASVWRKRVLWMLCGCFVYNLGMAWIGAFATLISAGIGSTGMGATTMGLTTVAMWAIGWAAFLAFALLKSKSPIAGPDRVPLTWTFYGGFALVLGYVLKQAGNLLQTTSLETSEYGKMFYWQAYGSLAVHTLVFAAIVALIWMLNEPKSKAAAVETIA